METCTSGHSRVRIAAGVLCAALFGFAFVAAPASCEWGLTAYFWSGVACVLLLCALPFLLPGAAVRSRIVLAALLAAAGCGVWVAGLFAANVRILCRLF